MTTENPPENVTDELEEEYDFKSMEGGVQGKYYDRVRAGSNVVVLDPDIADAFPTQESVNRALRMLTELATSTVHADEERK